MQNELTEVLYMSYDGMTDPLGQSQVIPYLQGLSEMGYHFTLISFEKQDRFQKYGEQINTLLKRSHIDWVPLSYTKKPPVLSTVYDVFRLSRLAFKLHREKCFRIVHCRSYITSLVGLKLKEKMGVKFIFDMRGFYADERVDGGLWNMNNPVYRLVYRYFKNKECSFLSKADYTISLTEAGKREIHSWNNIAHQPIPIQVIPCCVDLDKFSPTNVNHEKLSELRAIHNIKDGDFILSYLGSIGTWYMPSEMLDFFKVLLEYRPDARFLFISNDAKDVIRPLAVLKNIPDEKFIFISAPHDLVPTYLALSTVSIFFIKPVFSKKASSPTKHGEIMGMGIPFICNSGVGDMDEITSEIKGGYLVKKLSTDAYRKAVNELLSGKRDSSHLEIAAEKYYSLHEGVDRYFMVYQNLNKKTEEIV